MHAVNIKMTIAERIELILKERNITQVQLAEIIGINQASISRYKNEESTPDDLRSLLLAGLSETQELKDFWLQKLSSRHVALIEAAVNAITDDTLTFEERQLLSWWRSERASPDDPDHRVKTVLRAIIARNREHPSE